MHHNDKKLTGCIFLNRSYVRWQHAVVLELKNKYGVEKWCALGYGKGASEINNIQNEIKYEPLLIDDYLFTDAKDEVVDENYLTQKEKEYGHPYWWQDFINDRFTSINWPRQFYPIFNPTLTHEEIKKQFQYRIKVIEKMIDEVKPDFILLADAGALGVDVLYYIAKKKGIPTIVLGFSRFFGLSGITDTIFGTFNKMEEIFYSIREKKYISTKKEEAINIIKQFRDKPTKPYYVLPSEVWNKFGQSSIKKLVLFFKNFVRKTLDYFIDDFPKVYNYSPIDFIKHNITLWTNSLRVPQFDLPDKNEKYAFFALTSEPELTLLMQALYFSDQAWVVRAVAQSLPLNFKLYVKDHPLMFGYRNPKFYKEIRKFPNIKIIDTRADSIELIKNAELVVTITGTPGFEASFFKKPVIIFGKVNYDIMNMVKKCKAPDDLPLMIKSALENHTHDEGELVDFVSALLEDSFKVDFTRLITETDMEKVKQNPDIKVIADNVIKYLKDFKA